MILESNNSSVFSLRYHLILVTKFRRKVITENISKRLREIFENIAPNYNIMIETWNYVEDYVHIIMKGHPNTEMTKFINAYKSASSRLIKKEFPEIKEKLFQDIFWSKTFCLVSVGDLDKDEINNYIEKQNEKNK